MRSTAIIQIQGGMPSVIKYIKPIFAAPITKLTDKSKPPRSTTRVCPMHASPRKEAKRSIDLRFKVDIKPSTIREPIIKSPIRTAKPISALLLFFATELVIINTRSVRKNTTNERIFCHWKKSSIAKASATNAIIIASIPIIAPLLLLIRKLK